MKMKIVSFEPSGHDGGSLLFGKVVVQTGALWWKRRETRAVMRGMLSPYWMFVDNGEYTPGNEVERLERAYIAEQAMAKSAKEGNVMSCGRVRVTDDSGALIWEGALRDLNDNVIMPRNEWVRVCVSRSARREVELGSWTIAWMENLKENTP